MRFIEIPALITEDIENSEIVDITEPISVSINGTTMTIDGDTRVSGEATITLTGDTTVDAFILQNIKQPSIHKISVKTNKKGNFTYVPNNDVTASSLSTTMKTGSDFEILLITTTGGETYVDFDMADYTSPAVYTSNVLTGFDISELTSTYGATAKLYKPDGTLLTTVSSAKSGSTVNFGYLGTPGYVTYTLEVTDDLGRTSRYELPRKWISYAMSAPGFEKIEIAGNEYKTTTILTNISSSSKARVYKTNNHGYLGINFKIQGRNSTNDAWVDIDDTGENENADESKEFLAFGDYLYHRVWVKPTAKAATIVTSSNVITLSLTNFTEENLERGFENFDPFDINEITDTYVFEEKDRVGTIPFTITIGDQTYSNAFTATTIDLSIPAEPNTDFTASGPNMLHLVGTSSQSSSYMAEASGDGKYIAFGTDGSGNFKIMKGDPETGYADYATATFSGAGQVFGSISYDGKYIIVGSWATATDYEIFKHDETDGTYTKLPTTYPRVSTNDPYTHKPAFVPRSGNYDFALTGSDNNATCYIKLYKHNAGTDTWTEQPRIQDPTGRPNGDRYRGQFSKSFTRDGKYLMFGTYSTYGGYEMYTIDWDANTAVFSGANWVQNNNIGHSGAVTPDGKYALLFHNNSDSRKIFKNNDAGDWSSATDVTSEFTFNSSDDDQGGDICFFGEHGQYYISRMGGSNVRIYKWLDVTQKSVSLTYNDKDRITITKTGGLTTTTDKLYKDGVPYETLNSESVIFISETGVYQVISDDKYYSNKITVTTVSQTESVLRIGHRTCFLLRKDGKVMYWGESHSGSNGMGNTTETVNPTLHENLNAIPGGIKHIGGNTGDSHAKCAISGNGKLYTWGYNGHGSLGRNNTSNYENQGPWLVDTQASNTFTRCLSGYYTNFALQDNGYLWGCGYNGAYELADGSTTNRYQFVRLNIENVMDFCITHHLGIAVTTNNTVYMWGNNNNSAMGGLGTRTTPTHLTTLDGKNIVKVRCSHQTGYAISSDGKLYAWGYGGLSLLPYGSTGNIGTPTEMTWFSRKNIKLVDLECGWHDNTVCLALDDKGNMYVWGKDGVGALGDEVDAPNNNHWPFLLKTNIETISVGYTECGCIDKFGQVYTWGNGTRGAQNWIHGVVSDTHIYHPTSNNLSTGTTLIYDGYDTLKLGKNSLATSTVLYGSNTLSLDTKSDIFITDPHTYTFKVSDTSSGTLTYLSNVASTVSRPTGRVYPPKSGTRKSLGSRSASANHKHTWTVDGAVYGNGLYTAYSSGSLNSANQSLFECFDGHINQTCFHSANGQHLMSIILEMPQKIKLTKYAIYSRNYTGEYTYAPIDWKVYGSNDGYDWTELDSRTNETVSSWGTQTDHRDTKREYTVSGNTKYFSQYKYRVYVTNGSTYTVLSQIEYYGDEDEDFITYDGFGKVTVDTKGDVGATSNITYYSNTYEMGTVRDLYITDTGTGVYNANIYGSSKMFLGLGGKSLTVSATAAEFVWKTNEDQILYANDAEASDYFGFRVDIDGDYAVVSANGEDTGGSSAGAVYIFYKSNGIWTQQAKILPSDVAAGDDISHVAISGDYVLFGAYRKNSYVGAAYIFKRSGTTWTQHTKLTADDGEANDEYGHAVSIDGDYAVVGAWFEDTNGSNAGAAYIYKRDSTTDTWSQQQKIQSSDIQAGDHFTGYSVSINGNYIVLSAFGKDGTVGTDSGAAYIFKRDAVLDTWTQHQKLEPSDIQANDNFGWDVSLDGDYVAISSRYEDDGGSNAGAVYIFKRDAVSDTWTEQQKITSNDVEADDYFGWNVSIDGDRMVVGANNEDTRGSNAGAAYIFERSGSTWSEVKKITAGDAQANDSFGYSVAIDGDTIFVGSINKDTNVTDAGAVYVFEKGTKAGPKLTFDGYNKLTIDNIAFSTNEWPPTNGTVSSFTVTNSYRDAEWTISGASYGNGTYKSKWSANIIDANRHSGKAFNKIYGSNECFHANGTTAGNLDLEVPQAFILGSYDMRHRTNANTNEGNAPKDWVISGSNDGSTWTVLDTQTSQVYDPDVPVGGDTLRSYTITDNTTAYRHYRMHISSIDGGSHIVIGELRYHEQPNTVISTIKKDDAVFATTTSNTVYIRDTGTYTAEVKGSNAYAIELSREVTGQISTPPDVNKALYTIFKLGPTSGINVNDGWARGVNYIGVNGVNILNDGSYQTGYLYTWNQRNNTSFVQSTGIGMSKLQNNEWVYIAISSEWLNGNRVSQWGTNTASGSEWDRNREADSAVLYVDQVNFLEESELSNWAPADGTWTQILSWTPQSSGNGPFSVSNHTFGLSIAESYNFLSFDNYNKITLENMNQEDTATVSDPNGSIHEIGTAKTMYVKDAGEYVFKISGTDKYVESNVYVSSVDLAGAPTKPIGFNGYNKLTLINAGSNVSANVTYFSNTYELGSATEFYIRDAGTYDLEMSGSNVFALSNTVVCVHIP
jgi:alpha-tubulin suppressor-like RCC1 family protein